jgi:hypothetical protein
MKIEVIAVRGSLISSSIYEVRLPAKLVSSVRRIRLRFIIQDTFAARAHKGFVGVSPVRARAVNMIEPVTHVQPQVHEERAVLLHCGSIWTEKISLNVLSRSI